MAKTKIEAKTKAVTKVSRISQSDVPAYSLAEALRVSAAIAENYASEPTTPLDVAVAMNMSPSSGSFRMLTGASVAYGLTVGGYNVSEISLTDLGKTIQNPLENGADLAAKRQALVKPRIIREFLSKYDGSPIPKDTIAENVLVNFGVPREKAGKVLGLILKSAEELGLLSEIKSKKYVNLSKSESMFVVSETIGDEGPIEFEPDTDDSSSDISGEEERTAAIFQFDGKTNSAEVEKKSRRVFITHGKNKKFVDPIKKLLSFGELEAVVSAEKQSVSQPVPEKVMGDMRSCGAAIIHVDAEQSVLDKEANEHVMLNANVLIEIGAAMALYGKKFILLVRDGVSLPSNLQGLFEVRYEGDTLDGEATIKLLEAINEMKKIEL